MHIQTCLLVVRTESSFVVLKSKECWHVTVVCCRYVPTMSYHRKSPSSSYPWMSVTRYPSRSLSVTSTRWLGSFTCGGWADSKGTPTTWTATRVVWLRWGWPLSWARICTSWKNNSEWDSSCSGRVQCHIHTKRIGLHVSPICHTWRHGGKNSVVLVQFNSITNNHWSSVKAYSLKLSH